MLDIVQSVIIAVVIAVLVFGIHLMTMRTKVENDVFYRMKSEADATAAILQEEIKTLSHFVDDPESDFIDHLTFINNQDEKITIEFNNEERNLYIITRDQADEVISTRQYRLNLDQDEFNFSLLTRNHAPASVIDDIDFIRLNLGVRSRDEDFYQDMIQQFVVVISRDIYPRNIRLKQMEGTY